MPADIEKLSIDTIRCLAMDAVQKANAGHPGTAMALAPVAYVLFRERMRHDPADPAWPNRDRFVLSAGHACILQYAALHLSGYDLTMDDLEQFRQWGSRTPGIPSSTASTRPPASRSRPARSARASATPSAWRSPRPCSPCATTATATPSSTTAPTHLLRRRRHGGRVGRGGSIAGLPRAGQALPDLRRQPHHDRGLDRSRVRRGRRAALRGLRLARAAARRRWTNDDLRAALDAADAETARPSLIIVRTHIAIGAPHAQDTPEAHGAPLGEEEVRLTKQAYGWDPDKHFYVPDEVYEHFDQRERGAADHAAWNGAARAAADPELGAEFDRVLSGDLPDGWEDALPDFTGASAQATRAELGRLHPGAAQVIPELVGGSADLAPSTTTMIKGASVPARRSPTRRTPGRLGPRAARRPHLPLRHPRARHGRDPQRLHRARRLPRLRRHVPRVLRLHAAAGAAGRSWACPSIYVWTHDSIGLGEDGPTHQPIEHLASLRAIPYMRVIRPADATETAEAWRLALERRTGRRPRAVAPEAAGARPQRARARERRAQGRLRAGRHGTARPT